MLKISVVLFDFDYTNREKRVCSLREVSRNTLNYNNNFTEISYSWLQHVLNFVRFSHIYHAVYKILWTEEE